MRSYETVSEALNNLVKRGYTHDFNVHAEKECLVCNTSLTQLSVDDELYGHCSSYTFFGRRCNSLIISIGV